jgi:anti-sigma-K factor RskA
MNGDDDLTKSSEFERHAQGLLEESALRVDARVRSRLNQARHAALEEIAARPKSFWRNPVLVPASGAVAAAVLVAVLLTTRHGPRALPAGEQSAYEDIELLADTEGLDLIEGWDGSFYEWAAAQDGEDGGDGTTG